MVAAQTSKTLRLRIMTIRLEGFSHHIWLKKIPDEQIFIITVQKQTNRRIQLLPLSIM